jgi:hypothetical protein
MQATRVAGLRATGGVHEFDSVASVEDKMAKGQKRSNREKKKPKADKNKANSEPTLSPFGSAQLKGNPPKGAPGKRA